MEDSVNQVLNSCQNNNLSMCFIILKLHFLVSLLNNLFLETSGSNLNRNANLQRTNSPKVVSLQLTNHYLFQSVDFFSASLRFPTVHFYHVLNLYCF